MAGSTENIIQISPALPGTWVIAIVPIDSMYPNGPSQGMAIRVHAWGLVKQTYSDQTEVVPLVADDFGLTTMEHAYPNSTCDAVVGPDFSDEDAKVRANEHNGR